MKTSSVLVIFPVHNEENNLEQMLAPLLEVVSRERYDLVAIDDASTDDSCEILNKHEVPTITLCENLGYGAAIQTGYKYAVAKEYEYLIQVDGDGQHDPRFLPMIRRELRACDFVIGSRFLAHDSTPFPPQRGLYKGTALRKIGIRLFRALLYVLTRASISDPTSGYVGMNRKCMRFLSGDLYPYDFPDADVLLTLIRSRFRLCEVPVYMYHNHVSGRLHRGVAPVWYMFKVTLSLFVSSTRKICGGKGGSMQNLRGGGGRWL